MARHSRREFIAASVQAGLFGTMALGVAGRSAFARSRHFSADAAQTEPIDAPVLRLEGFTHPVVIESIDLLKGKTFHVVRTRTKDGATGIAVPNEKVAFLYPLLLQEVIPYFIGKDARDVESLLDGVYVYHNNYKMQSLALWCCVAWVEFSILDLLGRIAGTHVSALFGGKVRDTVPIYVASGNRETTPDEEVRILQQRVAETGAKAVKFKVGGRMSRNRDSLPKRSEELIELSRRVLGNSITIQADANGSYDVKRAIEIGRRLEGIGAYLFEEPCPFDHLDETKQVADALTIPISGGEQESSEYRFQWMIANAVLQIVQPDLHYYGGFIRSTRVARIADAAGLPITTHISSGSTGFADMANFFSFTQNMGRFQELKSGVSEAARLYDPPLLVRDGILNIPSGPGMGIAHTDELLDDAVLIRG